MFKIEMLVAMSLPLILFVVVSFGNFLWTRNFFLPKKARKSVQEMKKSEILALNKSDLDRLEIEELSWLNRYADDMLTRCSRSNDEELRSWLRLKAEIRVLITKKEHLRL